MAKASGVEEALLGADRPDGGQSAREEVTKQLRLAAPMVAGALLQNVIQMISVMFVGHLGELPLAGASMANSFATVTGFSLLVRPRSLTSVTASSPLVRSHL
jgi:MATE family multidrug resistance protein